MLSGLALPAMVVVMSGLAQENCSAILAISTPFFAQCSAALRAAAFTFSGSFSQAGNGACTFTAADGATAWGEWDCKGYELLGCRGTFKLAGGTARLEGASGEGTMIWRPSAVELKKQLDGATLDNATGILLWRDFKLKGR